MRAKGSQLVWPDMPDQGQSETAKWVTITPALAQKYLDSCSVEFQREIARHHVTYLANTLKAGEFEEGYAVIFAYIKGEPGNYLVDGYHRMHACIKTGIPFRAPVVYRECADMEAIRKTYAALNRTKPHTLRDVYHALGMPEKLGLNPTDTALLSTACVIIDLGGGADSPSMSKFPDYRRTELMEEWSETFHVLLGLWGGIPKSQNKLLRRGAVVSTALITLRYQPERAVPFWRKVGTGEGLTMAAPEYTLLGALRENRESREKRFGPGTIARFCAAAWNAHYEHRSLSWMKYTADGKRIPFYLKGTPFKRPEEGDSNAKPTRSNGPRSRVLAPDGRD